MGPSRLRIVLHDFSGHPFQVQLSRELARRGNSVLHLYCGSLDGMKGAITRRADDPACLAIDTVRTRKPFPRYAPLRRLASELRYGAALARRTQAFNPDVVISANTPLCAQAMLQRRLQRSGVRFVYWQQDVLSVAITRSLRQTLGFAGQWAGELFRLLEKQLLRRSDSVVVISPDYLSLLREWGLDVSGYRVVENWAPLDELVPLSKRNPWSAMHELADSFVFLYAGSLGLKHDPSLLLELADEIPEARVVVIAEGPGAEWLRERQAESPRANLMLMGALSYQRLPEALATADVLVALLEQDAGAFCVPSKVLSYMCAQRPILAAVPAANLSHRLLKRVGAGIAVEPLDRAGFVVAARDLFRSPARRSQAGAAALAYARTTFDIERIGEGFESIASGVVRASRTSIPTERASDPSEVKVLSA